MGTKKSSSRAAPTQAAPAPSLELSQLSPQGHDRLTAAWDRVTAARHVVECTITSGYDATDDVLYGAVYLLDDARAILQQLEDGLSSSGAVNSDAHQAEVRG